MKSLYDFPQAYDAVLGRPHGVVEAEVLSILELLARHNITSGKILELACGTCAHGIALARQGFQVVGIDRSAAMLAEARRRAREEHVPVQTVEADVVDFDLGVWDFDAALFMFETFPLITEYSDLVTHFDAVRQHVRQGGVYVVDVDAPKQGAPAETGEWGRGTLPQPDSHVETWYEDLGGDWIQATNHVVLHCRICLDGRVYETRDDWRVRIYSPWELALLARTLGGWQLDGFYSWRNLGDDMSDEGHYFTVFLAS